MATSTEKLIVELDAKTDGYQTKLDDVDKTNKKTKKGFKDTSKSAVEMGVKVVAAAVAVSAAITAMVVSSGKQRRELEILAKQSKLTVAEFQSVTFATTQMGINAEQFADISKDIADRLGEFASAGTGTFQDFLDVTKLSKKEGVELAKQWQDLSGDQVLGAMVKRMEEAGATGNQMTFVMESMGNDASRLTDLFKDNGAEIDAQRARFDRLTAGMVLTNKQGEQLKEVAANYDTLTNQLGMATDKISATLAPVVNDFFNDIIEVVPMATQSIINFINRFNDVKDISSENDLRNELESTVEAIENAKKDLEFSDLGGSTKLIDRLFGVESLEKRKEEIIQTLVDMSKAKEELRLKDEETPTRSGRVESDSTGSATGAENNTAREALENELELFRQSKLDKIVLIEENYKKELELLGVHHENLDLLEQQRKEAIQAVKDEEFERELEEDAEELERAGKQADELAKIAKNKAKESERIEKKEADLKARIEDQKLTHTEQNINAGLNLAAYAFEDSKAINAGIIIADTALGIQRALTPAFAGAPPNVAGAAIIAASGAIQLSNALSATKGGGSIVNSGGSSSQPEVQQPETSTLEVTEQSSASNLTTFETGTGDELGDMIAEYMNNRVRQGR